MVSFTTSSTGGLSTAQQPDHDHVPVRRPTCPRSSTPPSSTTTVSPTTSVGLQPNPVRSPPAACSAAAPSRADTPSPSNSTASPTLTTAATNKSLTVSTTSDPPTVTSANYTVDSGGRSRSRRCGRAPPSSGARSPDDLHGVVHDLLHRRSRVHGQQQDHDHVPVRTPTCPRSSTPLCSTTPSRPTTSVGSAANPARSPPADCSAAAPSRAAHHHRRTRRRHQPDHRRDKQDPHRLHHLRPPNHHLRQLHRRFGWAGHADQRESERPDSGRGRSQVLRRIHDVLDRRSRVHGQQQDHDHDPVRRQPVHGRQLRCVRRLRLVDHVGGVVQPIRSGRHLRTVRRPLRPGRTHHHRRTRRHHQPVDGVR